MLQANDEKGTLKAVLEQHPIPYRSAFMGVNVHDPAKLKESIAQVIAWGKVTRKYGGTFAVVNAGGVDRKNYDFAAVRTAHRVGPERTRQGAARHRPATPACISTPDRRWIRATKSTP